MKLELRGWHCEIFIADGERETLCFVVDRDGVVENYIEPVQQTQIAEKILEKCK